MISVVIGTALFFLGGFVGVAEMCLVQVGSAADKAADWVENEYDPREH